ncbi:RNA-binding protein [Cypionkella aquatica]|uniref:RNA-binding protein n=1 Tax=Cypionkella aquatica TaxID=1756042 RepID=A0AA37X1Y6_9RHOB|nr:CRTAC1 family protein [Cypionkella aquatica]GLS87050.1 RNA-binding protein [Cypionkella aquatica]
MKILTLGLALLPFAAHSETAPPAPLLPSFSEETTTAGVDQIFAGDWEYMVGGGVSTFDCNADARPDLIIAGGTNPAKLFVNNSAKGGDLSFAETASGLEQTAVLGAYAIDIDSDGIQDIVLLRQGENQLMRGLGDCKFQNANKGWGFDGGNAWSAAFAATWEKGQNWPTLAIGNYIDVTQDMFPWGSCTDNWLHRPDGDKFAPPIALKPSFCALSMLFSDWNRSGTPSLRIANDREYYKGGQEQLWHVNPGEEPRLYTDAEGWKRLRIWGMGIASYDLNFDGYPEYFVTSMADNKLQTLAEPTDTASKPGFKDVAFAKHAIAQRPYTGDDLNPSTGWHAQFEDVNNDGLADLFIAKGNVDAMPDFALRDPNNLLLQRADGTFVEAGDRAGVAAMGLSRGAALADFNADGLVDLVVVNRREPVQIWRNTTQTGNHWLSLSLSQTAPNRDAIGAWVEVKTGDHIQRREITIGGGQAGGSLGARNFGLGDLTEAEVRVIWPDGTEGAWNMLNADAAYSLQKP